MTARLAPDQLRRPVEPGDRVVGLDTGNRTVAGVVVCWRIENGVRRLVVAHAGGEVTLRVVVEATLIARRKLRGER